jgi:hydroxymethylpyrimidine/phosphomethylpyrimidine kinase
MKRVLTIAGSDSGGGAGIQADLKVITLLGGFGMSAITALTAQNTVGVRGIHEVPPRFVEEQMDAVLSDIGVDAVKTGMLANREIIEVVSRKIKQYRVKRVVVDPVMISKSGASLLRRDAQETLIRKLIPMAWVVTPNLMEASVLAGFRVNSLKGMRKAARQIFRMGAKYVVVKGGHLKGRAVDLFYDGERFSEIEGPRIESKNTHGTGCTFASAVATFLARGDTVYGAVQKAKTFITLAIQSGLSLGKGHGPTNPSAYVLREMERYRVIQELKRAVRVLEEGEIGRLIPEVSSNLGYALPFAEGVGDVAAFPGRIVRFKDSVATQGDPEFGASRHVASIILTVMKSDPEYCSAMNIRYSRETVARLRREGFLVGRFDRGLEPKKLKEQEGSSLEWGVGDVLRKMRGIPDFIYDEGDVGKEPMLRVLGRNPMEVVEKVLKAVSRKH